MSRSLQSILLAALIHGEITWTITLEATLASAGALSVFNMLASWMWSAKRQGSLQRTSTVEMTIRHSMRIHYQSSSVGYSLFH